MSRYKPVGWRGQPHRHSLAARGISTTHNYFAEKSKARQRLQTLAYGEPKDIEGAGGLINGASRIGAKVIQIATVRPLEFGIRSGKGEKREQV